jgi:hypothetical protein
MNAGGLRWNWTAWVDQLLEPRRLASVRPKPNRRDLDDPRSPPGCSPVVSRSNAMYSSSARVPHRLISGFLACERAQRLVMNSVELTSAHNKSSIASARFDAGYEPLPPAPSLLLRFGPLRSTPR